MTHEGLSSVHKGRPPSGRGVCPVRTFRGQGRGSSDADARIFWWKNNGFFEIYDVSARTRGVEPVRIFCGQGEGLIFRDFVWMSFMDGPLQIYFKKERIVIIQYCMLLSFGSFSQNLLCVILEKKQQLSSNCIGRVNTLLVVGYRKSSRRRNFKSLCNFYVRVFHPQTREKV